MNEKPTVLIADDDPDILELVAFRLRRLGCETSVAADGMEALRMITDRAPDLAILDIMMPRMDGFEVTERLRSQPGTRDIPVLLLTARSSDADVTRAFEVGANDYVRKPFSPQELADRVRSLIQGSSVPESEATAHAR